MNDFVAKPVVPEALYATLLRWLSHPELSLTPADSATLPVTDTAPSLLTAANIPDWLANIPGLDAALGLSVVMGNPEKYRRLLQMFANFHGEDMKHIQQELTDGNIQAAKHLAHNLKGTAGTLGAYRVSTFATKLDSALHQNGTLADCLELVQSGERELTQLVQDILNLPEAIETAEATENTGSRIDSEYLQPILAELKRLLAEDNALSNRLVLDSAELLRAALGKRYADFIRLIDLFDYEAALEMLREIEVTSATPKLLP